MDEKRVYVEDLTKKKGKPRNMKYRSTYTFMVIELVWEERKLRRGWA